MNRFITLTGISKSGPKALMINADRIEMAYADDPGTKVVMKPTPDALRKEYTVEDTVDEIYFKIQKALA